MEDINYELCYICQVSDNLPLIDPSKNPRLKKYPNELDTSYLNILQNINSLDELDELPKGVVFNALKVKNDGAVIVIDQVVETLKSKNAKWHKSCRSKVNLQKVKRLEDKQLQSPSPVKTRRLSLHASCSMNDGNDCNESPDQIKMCKLCDGPGTKTIHQAMTFRLDAKVRYCAEILNDTVLLAKLAGGDLIAIEFTYHIKCLVDLYRRAKAVEKHSTENLTEKFKKEQAFQEIVEYIESNRGVKMSFNVPDLVNIYRERLRSLEVDDYVHSTRFREKLLNSIMDLTEIRISLKHIELAFDEELAQLVEMMSESHANIQASILVKAANILRCETLKYKYMFDGHFDKDSEKNSVPPVLVAFYKMLLSGPGICENNGSNKAADRVSLSMSQLTSYNMVGERKVKDKNVNAGKLIRHKRERENPLVIYLAMKVYSITRSEALVNVLHEMGLCISYWRLRVISTDVANSVIAYYQTHDIVIPAAVLRGVLTIVRYDNINHQTRAMTCRTSFNGSCLSTIQFPTLDTPGERVMSSHIINPEVIGRSEVSSLPGSYTNLKEVIFSKEVPSIIPDINVTCDLKKDPRPLDEFLQNGYRWLEHVRLFINQEGLPNSTMLSWGAYFADLYPNTQPKTLGYMNPLFREPSTSPMMVYHAINQTIAMTNHLNPGQVPILVADQPLYQLIKRLQHKYNDSIGEHKFIAILGPMHVEKMMWETVGSYLEKSGWTALLSSSGTVTSGVAESFVGVSHLTRTRYFNQVTCAAIFVLKRQTYDLYAESQKEIGEHVLDFEAWSRDRCASQPQFLYWNQALELQLTILEYVKSLRTADFVCYKESMEQFMSWVFSCDRTHYKRCLTMHTRDMHALEQLHPAIHEEFMKGNFVCRQSERPFSAIALDQGHEQLIGDLKSSGGMIGLTEDPAGLKRLLVTVPEMSRLITEFEQSNNNAELKHHEAYKQFQKTFKNDVLALIQSFIERGNPFLEDSGRLIELQSYAVMPQEMINSVKNIIPNGRLQYTNYHEKRVKAPLAERTPWTDPIPMNKLSIMEIKEYSAQNASPLAIMKDEKTKITQLLLAANCGRKIEKDVFSHASSPYPPTICQKGIMFHGNKADIVPLLESEVPGKIETCPQVDSQVLDGPAMIHRLAPTTSVTLYDYIHDKVIKYLLGLLLNVNRLDIVWDIYRPDSLKKSIRVRRGSGIPRKVFLQMKMPTNFPGFLRVDSNKQDLFELIALEIKDLKLPEGKIICSSFKDTVVCSPEATVTMGTCLHEEADTRIFIHVADQVTHGYTNVLIRTSDSDVVVIAVSLYNQICGIKDLWIAYGSYPNLRYIPIHEISLQMGTVRTKGIAVFHAYSGSDYTSSFWKKGKKSAWDAWLAFPEVSTAFSFLSQCPENIPETIFDLLKKFVCQMYNSSCDDVDQARLEGLFYQGKDFSMLPTSSDALYQHSLRAAYQGGHVWGNALVSNPVLPCPTLWGWIKEESSWVPKWVTKPPISNKMPQLVSCGCSKLENGRHICKEPCKCVVGGVKCSSLCKCKGECIQRKNVAKTT